MTEVGGDLSLINWKAQKSSNGSRWLERDQEETVKRWAERRLDSICVHYMITVSTWFKVRLVSEASSLHCTLQSLMLFQYWNGRFSCEFQCRILCETLPFMQQPAENPYFTPPFQYWNHMSGCGVQYTIGTRLLWNDCIFCSLDTCIFPSIYQYSTVALCILASYLLYKAKAAWLIY